MNLQDDEYTVLVSTRDARQGAELALVLEARDITVQQEQIGRTCVLRVPNSQREAAWFELEQYARENANAPRVRPPPALDGSGWPGVVLFVAVLVMMVPAVSGYFLDRNWLASGRVDSAAILGGEWWRAVTGLTLHADAAHLLGNAGFGSFFGYSLSRSIGGGFAWLLILAAGIAGNLVNAWIAGPDHLSIGASTAVFATLGILTAYSWRTGYHAYTSWRQRVAPIIAGLGLLAFTGTAGENTDIGAHLFGFLAGFGCGIAVAATGWPHSDRVQMACGAGALAIVVGAWTLALTH